MGCSEEEDADSDGLSGDVGDTEYTDDTVPDRLHVDFVPDREGLLTPSPTTPSPDVPDLPDDIDDSEAGLCTGPVTDFNTGADLPDDFAFSDTVTGYRACGSPWNDVDTCKETCLGIDACHMMSHNANCCFLYEATTCPKKSSHSAAGQYTTYYLSGEGDTNKFYLGKTGDMCPPDDVIRDPDVCHQAVVALGVYSNDQYGWEGNNGNIPPGCSVQHYTPCVDF